MQYYYIDSIGNKTEIGLVDELDIYDQDITEIVLPPTIKHLDISDNKLS